jgi:hypothetical protein
VPTQRYSNGNSSSGSSISSGTNSTTIGQIYICLCHCLCSSLALLVELCRTQATPAQWEAWLGRVYIFVCCIRNR